MPHDPRFDHQQKQSKGGKKEHKKKDLIGFLHGFGLHPLVEVGGEPKPPLRVLDDPADLPPSLERLIRRVLGLDTAKILIQIALHLFLYFFTNKLKKMLFLSSSFYSLSFGPRKARWATEQRASIEVAVWWFEERLVKMRLRVIRV